MRIELDDLVRKLNPSISTAHLRRCFCSDDEYGAGCLTEKKKVLVSALKEAIDREVAV